MALTPGQVLSLTARANGALRTLDTHAQNGDGWCGFCWRTMLIRVWPCGARDTAGQTVREAVGAGIVLDEVGTVAR
jgi:hypothetical protein